MRDTPSERDRVADERDRVAGEREQRADERERRADEREREADERDRHVAQAKPKSAAGESDTVVDDGLFGITLGPPRELSEEVDLKEAPAPPAPKPPARTLSERLASAAADRFDTAVPDDDEDEPEE